jgi:hypothetical protein
MYLDEFPNPTRIVLSVMGSVPFVSLWFSLT